MARRAHRNKGKGKAAAKFAAKKGASKATGASLLLDVGPELVESVQELLGVSRTAATEIASALRRRDMKAAAKAYAKGTGNSIAASYRAFARVGIATLTAKEVSDAVIKPKAKKNPTAEVKQGLQSVLGYLMGLQRIYHSIHWKTQGEGSYGDHLLFERLYEGVTKNIDPLAERIVGYFGRDSIDPSVLQDISTRFVNDHAGSMRMGMTPTEAALVSEAMLYGVIRSAWKANQDAGPTMSLGLDDFLMGLASDRDEAVYLLEQKARPSVKSNPRRSKGWKGRSKAMEDFEPGGSRKRDANRHDAKQRYRKAIRHMGKEQIRDYLESEVPPPRELLLITVHPRWGADIDVVSEAAVERLHKRYEDAINECGFPKGYSASKPYKTGIRRVDEGSFRWVEWEDPEAGTGFILYEVPDAMRLGEAYSILELHHNADRLDNYVRRASLENRRR